MMFAKGAHDKPSLPDMLRFFRLTGKLPALMEPIRALRTQWTPVTKNPWSTVLLLLIW